jgi:hypothetical protein
MKVVYRHYESDQAHFMTGNPTAIPIAEIQPELELFELILVQRKE